MICGSLATHTDPLREHGGIQTGLFDVDGNGRVEFQDCHDACFLAYPAKTNAAPNDMEFRERQERNLTTMVVEEEFFWAPHGIRPDELRRAAGDELRDRLANKDTSRKQVLCNSDAEEQAWFNVV